MRILALHGVGHADADLSWQSEWRSVIERGLTSWDREATPEFSFPEYDGFFAAHDLHAGTVLEAFARLAASGLFHGLADVFRNRRSFGDRLEGVRWTAGMVAQWVAIEALRKDLRAHLAREIRRFEPDVIVAHSLGSLIAYDTLRRDEVASPKQSLIRGRTLVTLGSQIGNPAVRSTFGGRIEALETARFWWNLYNREDDVFTAPIEIPSRERFRQVATWFDIDGWMDHDGARYLDHDEAKRTVWQDIAAKRARGLGADRPAALAPAQLRAVEQSQETRRPEFRALLVGVAEYPNASDRLDGPVNDVFNVSAALQELGFPVDAIRVVLNERATAAGIRERLKWLLEDATPGDTMFFFYAGHGARIPAYGQDAEVDRIDECLVPYDFDWSLERAITDDEFSALYSQLPYESEFIAVLDCCHSGGMTRAGAKARVVAPPDDVRHRMMRWDRQIQMWVPRQPFEVRDRGREARLRDADDRPAWLGRSGSVRRLGRASSLWAASDAKYRAARDANGHWGPYAPVLYEACAEGESAYEYRHGVTSHGAFTYAFCEALRTPRTAPAGRDRLTFSGLLAETVKRVRSVVSEPQTPQLVCPEARRSRPVPGLAYDAERRTAKKARAQQKRRS